MRCFRRKGTQNLGVYEKTNEAHVQISADARTSSCWPCIGPPYSRRHLRAFVPDVIRKHAALANISQGTNARGVGKRFAAGDEHRSHALRRKINRARRRVRVCPAGMNFSAPAILSLARMVLLLGTARRKYYTTH